MSIDNVAGAAPDGPVAAVVAADHLRSDTALAERLTAAALEVPGVADVYPASSTLAAAATGIAAALVGRGDTVHSGVAVTRHDTGVSIRASIGVHGSHDAPGVGRAVSDALRALAAESLGSAVGTTVRVRVSSVS